MKGIIFQTDSVNATLEGRKWQTRRIVKNDKPRFNVGEIVYVKESWCECQSWEENGQTYFDNIPQGELGLNPFIAYKATMPEAELTWKSPCFMPEWASRIKLKITNIRKEKVSEISESDARAEGYIQYEDRIYLTPQEWFQSEWNFLHGEQSWKNDYVWVISFEIIESHSQRKLH
jgi:hypothetical protein